MQMTSSFSRKARSFNAMQPMDNDTLRYYAPSVFATEAHDSRSERFQHIPTIEVVEGMRKEGFFPFAVAQGGSRIEGKADFTKHLIRFRHESDIGNAEEAHEIVLLNAHDGTSAYKLFSGMIRFVCMNGLISGSNIEAFRVGHTGNAVQKVIEGSYSVLSNIALVEDSLEAMKAITLSQPEQELFAKAALQVRYEGEEAPITPQQALALRRREDAVPTLWNTFNVVQENLIRGGTAYFAPNTRRFNRTREVKNLEQNTKVNRALWTLAEGMRGLKERSAEELVF